MKFIDAVRAQMRLAMHSRAVTFMVAICILPWGFTLGLNALARRATSLPVETGPDMLIGPAGAIICLALGVVWGIMVWRDEPPRTRFYHWSLPMDTSSHDLARVVAFLVWCMVGLTLYMITGLIAMAFYDVPLRFGDVGLVPWLATYLAGFIGFGIGAAYSTAFERPIEYIFGTMFLVWGLMVIAVLYRLESLKGLLSGIIGTPGSGYGLLSATWNAGTAGMIRYINPEAPVQHLPVAGPLALWLTLATAAVVASAYYNRGRAR